MTKHSDLRYFKDGISVISQWTGTEYKNMEKVFLGVIAGAAPQPNVTCAVRAILDFIYYAHFELHSEESLKKLEHSWLEFHRYKQVFVNEGIRDDFNIPKVHSSEHYPYSIRYLGTADGYSTEGPERLHIDFAKVAYAASNRKVNYVKQMTVWLERQEAVYRFDSYLAWIMKNNPDADEKDDEEDIDVDDLIDAETLRTENQPQQSTQPLKEGQFARGYAIAKEPAYPRMTVASLMHDLHAPDFVKCLEEFLQKTGSGGSILLPIHNKTRVPVYSQMKVQLPVAQQITSEVVVDTIHASTPRPTKGTRTEVPAQQSTVLVKDSSAQSASGGPLHGLHVAQVRAIFKLPDVLAVEHSDAATVLLAYIEWFTPFHVVDADTGMHVVTWSTRQRRQFASIVWVTDIT
ncbi:hypothetical protein SCP_1403040 [Sparassis crispa]|uniref:Uncharacterized protein n=1 Tax=Sparassis crispa TaxID=139825 RepID=A0A401H382_9APHY|nr:hypothetical protein SCP_1403040 [Sparassis crispa]GBE88896.1 hypothetical protein SCP_1403040 [Sparassis crispa]